MNIIYSNHAVKQMFKRAISTDEVEYVLQYGETINDYPEDKPYPSKLIFAFYNERPLHIVCCYNMQEDIFIIITVYQPTTEVWKSDYKTRKNN